MDAKSFIDIATSKTRDKVVEYFIPQWDVTVKVKPCGFAKYHELLHDVGIQERSKNPNSELYANKAWILACLVDPQLSEADVDQLDTADSSVMMRLALKCRVVSGDLPEGVFDEINPVDFTTPSLSEEVDTSTSTEPASNISEPSQVEPVLEIVS